MLYVFGFIVSLLLWGFGLLWLFFAVATIYKCRTFPFNMGWWGFTFPLGLSKSSLSASLLKNESLRINLAVFALSTIQFGKELESSFFKVLGTVSPLSYLLYSTNDMRMTSLGHVRHSFYPLDHRRNRHRPRLPHRKDVLRALSWDGYEAPRDEDQAHHCEDHRCGSWLKPEELHGEEKVMGRCCGDAGLALLG
jgi:Voltage-dependent anion channel